MAEPSDGEPAPPVRVYSPHQPSALQARSLRRKIRQSLLTWMNPDAPNAGASPNDLSSPPGVVFVTVRESAKVLRSRDGIADEQPGVTRSANTAVSSQIGLLPEMSQYGFLPEPNLGDGCDPEVHPLLEIEDAPSYLAHSPAHSPKAASSPRTVLERSIGGVPVCSPTKASSQPVTDDELSHRDTSRREPTTPR